ncbi:MAG: hypothetical protein QHG98_07360 [Methanothrix sp.]|jgi:hypothetical protein|nr:hypothetical protein [Methanothrix sp.]
MSESDIGDVTNKEQKKTKRGRRKDQTWVFTQAKRMQFLELVRRGSTLTYAAESIGVPYATIDKYRNRHKNYDKKVREAMRVRVTYLWDSLYKKAMEGNVQALMTCLLHATRFLPLDDPDRFLSTQRIEVGLQNDPLASLSTEEVHAMIKRMLKSVTAKDGKSETETADQSADDGNGATD